MRNTAKRTPGQSTIREFKKRPPAVSDHIQIGTEKKQVSSVFTDAPILIKLGSAGPISKLIQSRASFGPQAKPDLPASTKHDKLLHLLDTKTVSIANLPALCGSPTRNNLFMPVLRVPPTTQPKQPGTNENVEDTDTAKHEPTVQSLNAKEPLTIKLHMNPGDMTSSPTEHESLNNIDSVMCVQTNEVVLDETPVSIFKNPVRLSVRSSLHGSFTDRQSHILL